MSNSTEKKVAEQKKSAAFTGVVLFGVLFFLAGAILPLASTGHVWMAALRWVGLLAFLLLGLRKRSLTYWIFVAMLVGLEIGLDRPQLAEHLRILSDIFLRLIKVIVAPLILGTLVTGVAGHGNLKSVGRIGIKSLVYFEAVTTIALFIGVAAINLSRAADGLSLSPSAAAFAQQNAAPPLRWDDFLLHIFPENIVKAAAENQILQVAVFAIFFGIALTRIS